MNRLPFLVSVLVPILLASPRVHAGPAESMQRATTLYRLSLATDVDSRALRSARQAYEAAIKEADPVKDAELVAAAKAGIEQTEARLENSDEMFRNVWSGAWMFRGDHEVYEWYDSAVELALDRAWSQVVDRLTFRGRPRLPVYARCVGDDESCGILRDMVLLSSEAAPHLRPVPDDVFERLQSSGALGPVGAPPVVKRSLAQRLPESELLVVDIEASGPVDYGDPVSLVGVTVYRTVLSDGSSTRVAHAQDVGVDVIPRWLHSYALLLLAIGLVILGSIGLGLGGTPVRSVAMGLVLAAAGGALLTAANEVLDVYMPAMDDLAWDPEARPLISTWIWPLGLGLVFAGGGVLLSLVVRETLQAKLQGLVDLADVRWDVAGLPVVIGAVVLSGFHLPTEFGTQGWALVVGLLVGLGLTTAGLGRVVLGEVENRLAGSVVRAGLLALLGGTAAIVSALLGMHWALPALLGLAGVPALLVSGAPVSQAGEAAEAHAEVLGAGDSHGTLNHPSFVDRAGLGLAETAEALGGVEGLRIVHLVGESGVGKTRWANELIATVTARGARPCKVGVAQPSQASVGADPASSPPYELLEQLLGGILSVLSRLDAMEKTDAAGAALADAGASLLESLPGVGLIMGMLPEGEEATAGERLKADVVDAVRNVLGPAGGGRDLIWFIDDLHGADDESWEILSHLFRDLTERPVEGARLIAVLAEQVEEGSRTAPLDKHCDIERLALPPLAAEEIAPLVAATGLRTPDKRQVDWLLTMAEVPAHLLSVLRYLELQGLITDGALPSADDLIAMPDPVPADLLERELRRLEKLPEEHLLILEMAAQCGQSFDGADVAAGLGEPRMTVLSRLRQIELTDGLIEDRDEDDRFSFLMRTSRQALCQRTLARRSAAAAGGEGIAELARAFHAQVADSLRERFYGESPGEGRSVSGEKIYRHLSKAGPARAKQAPDWALVAAQQAAQLFSWKRAGFWADKASDEIARPTELQQDQIRFIQAQVLFADGGQAQRDEARELFKDLIESPHVDARQALLTWFEIAYEEKQRSYLEELQGSFAALKARQWPEPYMAETVAFYEILVEGFMQPRGDANTLATVERLDALRTSLELPSGQDPGPEHRFPMLLLARVCNEIALNLFFLRNDIPEDRDARFEASWQESLDLKVRYGDLAGQAAAWGLYGDFHNFTLRKLPEARVFYERDLDLLQRMGDLNKIPGLINKMGLTIYNNPEEDDRVARGLDHAQRSLEMALELEREIDVFFAAGQVLTVAFDNDLEPGVWTPAAEALADPELIGEIQSVFMKRGLAKRVADAMETIDASHHGPLKALLELLPDPDPPEPA